MIEAAGREDSNGTASLVASGKDFPLLSVN